MTRMQKQLGTPLLETYAISKECLLDTDCELHRTRPATVRVMISRVLQYLLEDVLAGVRH